MQRDASVGLVFIRCVGILHVAAILEHEHPSIAVERDRGGFLNVWIGQHELEVVAGLQDELVQLLLRRERRNRRFLGEIDARVRGVVELRTAGEEVGAAATASTACCVRRRLRGSALRGCLGGRCLRPRRRRRCLRDGHDPDREDHQDRGSEEPRALSSGYVRHAVLATGSDPQVSQRLALVGDEPVSAARQ